ncbi:response regulator [Chitinophaga parva]|uniref:Response regulator n=1 Tax=Chitinophaga parva TaxID=2169414 RepID=A0A2T7BIX0_9BACT|nr:response regulator [Chitinophaga parva]PUZ26203.1 response regulator [Chitinophaga parva]
MDDKLKRKIFLVDDDPFSLTMYGAYLDGQGYKNVSGFASGGTVLEKLKEGPDIVLLDHRPGDMPGLEVLDRIKRYNPNIYVVLMSSQEEKKMAEAAVQAGAFDYITKEGAVLPRITEVLNRIFTVQEYLNKKNSQSSRFFFL